MKFDFNALISHILNEGGKVESKDGHAPVDMQRFKAELEKEKNAALNTPPKIAIIGKSGVGKSSTINALFGTDLEVSDNKACTKKPEANKIHGKAGDIVVYDMPGLGEDIDVDEQYLEYYQEVLPEIDIAIWVFVANAVGRSVAYDQMMLRKLQESLGKSITDKIIFGVNQVDLIEPNDWIEIANMPSEAQEINIHERTIDLRAKMSKVLNPENVICYSAKKRYNLEKLFSTMISACANQRGWVLNSRASIADYMELVDPDFLQKLKSRKYE